MTRRALLAGLAARPSGLRLGFSLYGLKEMPVVEALRVCRQIGYEGVELCLNPGWPAEPKRLDAAARRRIRSELERLGLGLPSLMENLTLFGDFRERMEAAAKLAHDLAPHRPPLIETVLGGKPEEWESVKHPMLARLMDWKSIAQRTRTVIALKAHVGGAVNSPERLNWLLDRANSPWIRAVYDYSHFQLIGLGMEETIRALAARTVFVHVKDAAGSAPQYRFLLSGEGQTDYREYLRLLVNYGYQGFVVPEVSAQVQRLPGYDGIAAARKCFMTLSRAMAWTCYLRHDERAGISVPRTWPASRGGRVPGFLPPGISRPAPAIQAE